MAKGRCDVWTPFSHATKSQASDLYVHFFDPGRSSDPVVSNAHQAEKPATELVTTGDDQAVLVRQWASTFAARIPEHKVSMSALQGYLMRYKRQPWEALEGVDQWIQGGFAQTLPAET